MPCPQKARESGREAREGRARDGRQGEEKEEGRERGREGEIDRGRGAESKREEQAEARLCHQSHGYNEESTMANGDREAHVRRQRRGAREKRMGDLTSTMSAIR